MKALSAWSHARALLLNLQIVKHADKHDLEYREGRTEWCPFCTERGWRQPPTRKIVARSLLGKALSAFSINL
eukprot:1066264-Amphidinium_carterae.1